MSDAFLKKVDQLAQNWRGESRGPAEIEADWALYGHAKRAEALDQIDAHISRLGHVEGDDDLKSYTAVTRLRRRLFNEHQALLKINR